MKNLSEIELSKKDLLQKCVGEYYNYRNNKFNVYDDYALINYDDFELLIVFVFNEYEDVVNYKLKFSGSEIYFTFYDIFNVFDIDDFEVYTFVGCFDEKELFEIIKKADNTVSKYYSYLEIVASSMDMLHKLEDEIKDYFNTEYDYFDDSEDDQEFKAEIYADIISYYGKPEAIYGDAIVFEREKLYKRLKKYNKKGRLNLYEKRFLKYLDNGGEVPCTKVRNNRLYSNYFFKGIAIIGAAVFSIMLVLYFVINKFIYNGAELYFEKNHIRDNLMFGGLAFLFLLIFLVMIFCKYNFPLFVPKEDRNWFKRRTRFSFSLAYLSKWDHFLFIIISVLGILFGFFCYSFLFDNVGYYDDHIRFGVTNSLAIVDVQYEDLKIYKVLNSDVSEGHEKFGNVCAISGENADDYYEFGEVNPNGETQKKLNEIAEEYNIEVIEINSIEDLS